MSFRECRLKRINEKDCRRFTFEELRKAAKESALQQRKILLLHVEFFLLRFFQIDHATAYQRLSFPLLLMCPLFECQHRDFFWEYIPNDNTHIHKKNINLFYKSYNFVKKLFNEKFPNGTFAGKWRKKPKRQIK